MVKLGQLAIAGLALLFLARRGNSSSIPKSQSFIDAVRQGEPIRATDAITQSASPYLSIMNNAATEVRLGVLNPFEGGPQQIPNVGTDLTDYSPWGGVRNADGGWTSYGASFAFINGVNIRNPSEALTFDRGLGVYR